MTTDNMMAALSAYYGEAYSGIGATIMRDYLDALSNGLRAALFQVVVRKYSRRWGKAPDVATLDEYIEEAQEAASPKYLELPAPVELTDAERAELNRLAAEARKTPEGRMLLGIIGKETT